MSKRFWVALCAGLLLVVMLVGGLWVGGDVKPWLKRAKAKVVSGLKRYVIGAPGAAGKVAVGEGEGGGVDATFVSDVTERGRWQIAFERDGRLTIFYRDVPVIRSGYVSWGPRWGWVRSDFQGSSVQDDGRLLFQGQVAKLGLRARGYVEPLAGNQVRLGYQWQASKQMTDVIGQALVFHVASDSPVFNGGAGGVGGTGGTGGGGLQVQLLAGNMGWTCRTSQGDQLRFEFDKPTRSVVFPFQSTREVRSFFYAGDIEPGQDQWVMTITLPDGATTALSPWQRYAVDTDWDKRWLRGTLLADRSPVDVSFLNEGHRPAGKHGFLQVKGDQLVFQDGTPGRFWGCNVAASALFGQRDLIKQQAKRIAQLGFNLVRLHHHDSTRWVKPTVIDQQRDDSKHFNKQAMASIDWWIKCLKEQGVYVWLDMHVGRQFKAGDGIKLGYDEIAANQMNGKGFNYFNRDVKNLMMQFQQAYMSHVNRFTKLAYKDDPAVMGLLLTNENNVTYHFGHMMLANKNRPVHHSLFKQRVQAFSDATGLPVGRVGQTWKTGASKLFLNDVEHDFNVDLLAQLRSLGVKVPIATTNMFGVMPAFSLPAINEGDVIDAHSYGLDESLSANPRYRGNFISYLAGSAVWGKPMIISEWNVPFPATDRFVGPMYMMSIASLQSWDAPMLYNYAQLPLQNSQHYMDRWSTFTDPAITALMPAAAIAYRRGHVQSAKKTYCLLLDEQAVFDFSLSHTTSATLRTLVEMSKVTLGLPDSKYLDWDQPARPTASEIDQGLVTVIDQINRDFIPGDAHAVVSDTGELRRDWRQGIATINTPGTQSVSGWVGGQNIKLADVQFQVKTAKATVVVTSMDDLPIGRSRLMLITAIARAKPAKPGRMPYLSEPVLGQLTLASNQPSLQLVSLRQGQHKRPARSLSKNKTGYVIDLRQFEKTHWWLLVGPSQAGS